jgi:starvation-inducible DNA-binding protein
MSVQSSTNLVNIGLSEETRTKVSNIIQILLADEHLLYLKSRNFHWNVQGMAFLPLHELFEEQYSKLAEVIDDVAERIRSLGFFTEGSMAAFQRLTRLKEAGHLDGNAQAMIDQLLNDHEQIIRNLREDALTVEALGDEGTVDFLISLIQEHEKMAWMLRVHIM